MNSSEKITPKIGINSGFVLVRYDGLLQSGIADNTMIFLLSDPASPRGVLLRKVDILEKNECFSLTICAISTRQSLFRILHDTSHLHRP